MSLKPSLAPKLDPNGLVPFTLLYKMDILSCTKFVLEPGKCAGAIVNVVSQPQELEGLLWLMAVMMLFELCQKQGKQVDIKYWKNGEKNVATVYVDGKFIASSSSVKKETAKLNAAKQALLKLLESMPSNVGRLDFSFGLNKSFEIDGAKQKLHELCGKKKWPKPIYGYEHIHHLVIVVSNLSLLKAELEGLLWLMPVTMLFELCQKQGKQVDIKYWKNGEKNVATVYVNGKFIASGSSEKKETAKLNAAKQALLKLSESMPANVGRLDFSFGLNKSFEIDGAKQKLQELCGKKKWPKPTYSLEKDEGPPHHKKYVSSVQIPSVDGILYREREMKSQE
nr:ribonuclease 3-like protein 2 [Quercus suber]